MDGSACQARLRMVCCLQRRTKVRFAIPTRGKSDLEQAYHVKGRLLEGPPERHVER